MDTVKCNNRQCREPFPVFTGSRKTCNICLAQGRARQKIYYRNNPEWREKILAKNRERRHLKLQDPVQRAIYNAKKTAYVRKRCEDPAYRRKLNDASLRFSKRQGPNYRRNSHFKTRYGITLGQRDQLAAAQKGLCAACGTDATTTLRGLLVDHCHITGKLRELLCFSCNTALGHVRDSEEVLIKLIAYLKKHRPG
jgi:hypothetical protein